MITREQLASSQEFERLPVDVRWKGSGKILCGVKGCSARLGVVTNRVDTGWGAITLTRLRDIATELAHGGALRGNLTVIPPCGWSGFRGAPGDAPTTYRFQPDKRGRTKQPGRRDDRQFGRVKAPIGMQTTTEIERGGRIVRLRGLTLPCVLICHQCGAPNIVTAQNTQ